MPDDPTTLDASRRDVDPQALLRPEREITGSSAILLPFTEDGTPDWNGYRRRLGATFEAGLIPAVNMDTGYAGLISEDTRRRVLAETQDLADGQDFVAGAFVSDAPGRTSTSGPTSGRSTRSKSMGASRSSSPPTASPSNRRKASSAPTVRSASTPPSLSPSSWGRCLRPSAGSTTWTPTPG